MARHAWGRRGIPLPYQLQPLVAPQFEHLGQGPDATRIEPHSWQVGASVSATQILSSAFGVATAGAAAAGSTGTFGRSSWFPATCSFGWRNFALSQRKM